ncbi:MAG: hypothetical protein ACI4JM_06800 [Oscillospiraceae bacterium]
MKRFAAFVLAAIMMLSFTACQSEMEKRNEVLPEEEFIRIASDMIQEHYDGILEKDYDKCFGSYAPFYLAAVEDEMEYYNYESKDEYIKESDTAIKEKFGDDVEISFTVSDVERLSLKRISNYKKLIKDIFELGTPHITDGIQIIANVTYSGSLDELSEQTAWTVFVINDKYYLYDSYYEDIAVDKKEQDKPSTNVVVIE